LSAGSDDALLSAECSDHNSNDNIKNDKDKNGNNDSNMNNSVELILRALAEFHASIIPTTVPVA